MGALISMNLRWKIVLVTALFVSFWLTNCDCNEGSSGCPKDPVISKHQDDQVDTNQNPGNVGAGMPRIAMSANITRATRIFVAWLDQRTGESNVYFNCRDLAGNWLHSSDLKIDTGRKEASMANELAIVCSQDGQFVHIVWSDCQPGKEAIWYNRSIDGGQTFEAQARCLSPNWPFPYKSSQPRLACSTNGQILYVVYRYGLSDIVMRYSKDYGASWSTQADDQFFAQELFRGINVAKDPSIACSDDGRYCHIVWQGGYYSAPSAGNYVFYRCWDGNAANWVTSEEIDASYYAVWHKKPQVACIGNGTKAFVVYHIESTFNEILYTQTTDFGNTFVAPEQVSDFVNNDSFFPRLYCNRTNGDICVIWERFVFKQDPNQWQLKARKRNAAGTWSAAQNISAVAYKNNKHYVLPEVAGYGADLSVAWIDFSNPPNQYLYLNSSTDTGATWSGTTAVSTPGATAVYHANYPWIAVNSDKEIYVVWTEKRGSNISQIFGRDMTPDVRVGVEESPSHHIQQTPHAFGPKLAANGANVYSTWLADLNGGQDVYFANSKDHGNSWEKDFIVNQTPGEICSNQQISCDVDDIVYLVWEKSITASKAEAQSPGHIQGEAIQQIVFQRYDYSTGTKPSCQILSAEPELDDPVIGPKPHSLARCPAPRLARDMSLATKLQLAEERGDMDAADNGTLPILTHNNEGYVYVFYDNSEGYVRSQLRRYLSRDHGNTWERKLNQYLIGDLEMLNSQIMAEADFLYWALQVRNHQSNCRSDIVFIRYSQYLNRTDILWRVDRGDAEYEHESTNPSISKDRNRLLIAWTDFRDGQLPDVYYSYSLDHGMHWASPAVSLTQDTSDTYAHGNVKLASSVDYFYAVWSRYEPSTQKYAVIFNYVYIDEYGLVVTGQPMQLNGNTANAMNPQIVSDGQRIYVAWQDERYGKFDIFVRTSNDNGTTWSSEQRFNTNPAGISNSIYPNLATSDQWTYVIWEDYRYGRNVFFEAR